MDLFDELPRVLIETLHRTVNTSIDKASEAHGVLATNKRKQTAFHKALNKNLKARATKALRRFQFFEYKQRLREYQIVMRVHNREYKKFRGDLEQWRRYWKELSIARFPNLEEKYLCLFAGDIKPSSLERFIVRERPSAAEVTMIELADKYGVSPHYLRRHLKTPHVSQTSADCGACSEWSWLCKPKGRHSDRPFSYQ